MTVLNRIATALQCRDEAPNCALAEAIVRTRDRDAVSELVKNLQHRDRDIQSDCIKVLYEIGARQPTLIAAYHQQFGILLDSSNNRMVWGAMTALDAIAAQEPGSVYKLLPEILAAAESGSVIARDHAVGILIKLAARPPYAARCFPVLLEQLRICPNNQLPMYAEMSAPIVTGRVQGDFTRILRARMSRLEKESQKKRVMKVLTRLRAEK